MWTSALFGEKTSNFSKFMVCPHGQGELRQCEFFEQRGREGESIFLRFYADDLYGQPLTKIFSMYCVLFNNQTFYPSRKDFKKLCAPTRQLTVS